ncbi:MAG: hypothetical protein AAFP19_08450 [Bacteroidota bacterium]
MATTTTTTSAPNDSYATTQTINFIEQLQTDLTNAQSVLSQKTAKINNVNAQQTTLSQQYSSAQAAVALAQNNLTEAENTQTQITTITEFFNQRQIVTGTMVSTAQTTATKMYEATVFLGTQGLDRVDDILSTVLAYNKTDTDTTTQWTHPFISAVQLSSAKGQTALNAAATATKDAFTTLVSTLQIDYRTQQYYQQCLNYQKMMAQLISRLTTEYILLKAKADGINQQLQQVLMNQSLLNSEVQAASFNVAQLQAEFTAAQKGASYLGTAAAAAKSSSN